MKVYKYDEFFLSIKGNFKNWCVLCAFNSTDIITSFITASHVPHHLIHRPPPAPPPHLALSPRHPSSHHRPLPLTLPLYTHTTSFIQITPPDPTQHHLSATLEQYFSNFRPTIYFPVLPISINHTRGIVGGYCISHIYLPHLNSFHLSGDN